MAINRLQKFQDIILLQHFLNGGIIGGEMPKNQPPAAPGWFGLVGLTLIFTEPTSNTVTFVASNSPNYPSDQLMLSDVKDQIQTVMTGLNVLSIGGRLAFVETTPTSGVAITAAGTANSIFGFDTANPTSNIVYVPPGVTPSGTQGQWTWAYSVNENYHTVYTWGP